MEQFITISVTEAAWLPCTLPSFIPAVILNILFCCCSFIFVCFCIVSYIYVISFV